MNDLWQAIVNDDAKQVRRLLRQNDEFVSSSNRQARLFESKLLHWLYVGDTPLHLAAAGHRVEIVKILLGAGADPNSSENHRRSSPVHYAADGVPGSDFFHPQRQVETLQALLAAGGELQAQDKNGAAPLHRAVRTRCAAAVRLLLEAGADPAGQNKSGSTPFHLAVQNTGRGGSGNAESLAAQGDIIDAFLERGVSPRLKDGQGKTVFECASSEWIANKLRSA